MCLTLFDEMDYDMVSLKEDCTTEKYRVLKRFQTSHGTLYLMSGFDDNKYKHTTKFPNKKRQEQLGKERKEMIRTCIVWRWLGRRAFAFDRNYGGKRKRCEAYADLKVQAKKRFPEDPESRKNFAVGKTH